MTTFPTLTPGSRTFTPGEYPHSSFVGMSGAQNRVRNSNVMLGSQLRLTFAAISESQMLSILAHYNGQTGGFSSFALPTSVWSGVGSIGDYQLAGYGWIYTQPPTVSDAMCADAYDVEVTLETVPPEGTAIAGLEATVGITLAAGAAGVSSAVIPGVTQTVTISLAPGAASTAGADPNFSSVSLLLHMNGSNGSTTFTDSSSNARTITAVGDAKISTAQSKFGGASCLLDGSGDALSATVSVIGTGAYTIEGWFYTGEGLVTWRTLASLSDGLTVYYHQGAVVGYGGGMPGSDLRSKQGQFGPLSALAANTWHHWAITRTSGGVVNIFVDGLAGGLSGGAGSAQTGNTYNATGTTFRIGANPGGGENFNGYIDEIRLTPGVARYSGDYTVPTAAFPDS